MILIVMDNELEKLLQGQIDRLQAEVSFLRKEIKRKDNDWTKAWRRMQRLFNDRAAEVVKLEELIERLAKPQKELTYG